MKKSVLIMTFVILFAGCSINKMVVNRLADSLSTGESTVFTGEEDPELIEEALPFALKMYESLLEQTPENEKLLFSTGQAFALYSFAFVQGKAEQLSDEQVEQKSFMMKRAKRLYLRGRDHIIRALEVRYPGFKNALKIGKVDGLLGKTGKEDVPLLFYAGMTWVGAFSVDPFDMELAMSRPVAAKLIERAYKLDPGFEDGSIDNFYGSSPYQVGKKALLVPVTPGPARDDALWNFEKL